MYNRETYLNFLIRSKDTEFIKIITGVRRSGKSFLLKLYQEYLVNNNITEENIIYINFEDYSYLDYRDDKYLHQSILDRIDKKGKCYLLLDEIQFVNNWQMVINSLRLRKDLDIYITGSNANLLSGELATHLAGRYIQIEMLPLTFSEYLLFKKVDDKNVLFNKKYIEDYIRYGGFPAVVLQDNTELKINVLEDLYDSIILNDIVKRSKINEIDVLDRLVKFLLDNIGQQVSIKKIADTFESSGLKTSTKTITNFMDLLVNSFLFYKCERYDLRGKARLRQTPKYYVIDTGLRNAVLGAFSGNLGGQLENTVFLSLYKQGYEIYTGKFNDKEIDFVATKSGKTLYIQVCYEIPKNSHETDNLLMIKDNYKKIVITQEFLEYDNIDGIEIVHINDFLLNGIE